MLSAVLVVVELVLGLVTENVDNCSVVQKPGVLGFNEIFRGICLNVHVV